MRMINTAIIAPVTTRCWYMLQHTQLSDKCYTSWGRRDGDIPSDHLLQRARGPVNGCIRTLKLSRQAKSVSEQYGF